MSRTGTKMMRQAVTFFIVVVLLCVGIGFGIGYGVAKASTTPTGTKICAQYWHMVTGGKYVIRNDYFGPKDTGQCITNRNVASSPGNNFRVSVSRAADAGWKVQAYPNIFLGCEYGVCSPGTNLPHRAGTIASARTEWRIQHPLSGLWNAGYDIWLSRTRQTNGKADGAELMIWPAARGVAFSSHSAVRIEGVRYYYASWFINRGGRSWHYIQFRRVVQTNHMRVNLLPFLRYAASRGNMSMNWWLESVEAGFEIWNGGTGLATTAFSATVTLPKPAVMHGACHHTSKHKVVC